MEGKNGGVTERAVYWPRKCSQAAGQSAWLVPPSVTNSPLADESRPLFAVSINGSLHQRRAVYLPVHRPHTQLPLVLRLPPTLHPSRLLVFLPLSLSLSLSRCFYNLSLCLPPKKGGRITKKLRVQQMWSVIPPGSGPILLQQRPPTPTLPEVIYSTRLHV